MTNMYDVAVVGGGFAGVTAARDLSLAGHSVVLLEGRDRLGGRTYLGDAFGRKMEFGGTYVHWTQANVWREMQRYGLTVAKPMASEKVYWLADGAVRAGSPLEYAAAGAPLIERALGDARERFPYPFDITAGDVGSIERESLKDRIDSLHLSDYERDVLGCMLSSLVHSEGEQGIAQFLYWVAVNLGSWDAFIEVAGTWPIVGGTGALLDAIVGESKAEVRLSTPVSAVEDDGSGITLTTTDGEQLRARQAVFALPLNTLGDVDFTPPPAEPVRAMVERKQPMKTVKIWARVRGEIEAFTASAPAGKHPIATARTEYRHEGDTLVVCFGPDASVIDGRDREAVQEALRLFVPGIEVVDTACHDWVNDPMSQGTWAHHRPGALTGTVPLMREPHGRVHFAGADFAGIGLVGIDGAIETGANAARAVTQALASS
ncbi:flavin monoamine oxidase family protein [Streptomyces sp. NPDC004685]